MNILFINEFQVNENQGGVQRVTQILADFFNENEFGVFYIFCKQNKKDLIKKVNEYSFPDLNITSGRNCQFLKNIISGNKIDIIINQYGFNTKLLKLLLKTNINIPIISCLHSSPDFELKYAEVILLKNLNIKNTWFINLKIILRPLYLFLLRKKISRKLKFIYLNSTITVLLSDKFIPIFLKISKIRNSEKLKVIGNPINPRFNSSSVYDFKKQKSVLYVGRLNTGKRVDLLLQIWKMLQLDYPDWTLDILGSGAELNRLKELSKSLNLYNVFFYGQSDKVEHYYQTASIFVSSSAFEGFPLTLIEAQIFGVVPIAYNTYESINDVIIDNETGFIVPDLNQELFLDKLKQLMQSDKQRNIMARKAIEFAKKFDIEQIGKEWLTLFEKVRINQEY